MVSTSPTPDSLTGELEAERRLREQRAASLRAEVQPQASTPLRGPGRPAVAAATVGTPGPRERRLAVMGALASVGLVAVVAPVASHPLPRLNSLMPAFEGWSTLSACMMAMMLFSQFAVVRSRGLLILASGCLFTGLAAFARLVVTPIDLSPSSFVGGDSQASTWFFLIWTAALPMMVTLYSVFPGAQGLASGMDQTRPRLQGPYSIGSAVFAVLAIMAALWTVVGLGSGDLPQVSTGHGLTPLGMMIAAGIITLAVVALVIMLRRKPRTLLDGWLILALAGWLFQFVLGGVLSKHAYDLAWYASLTYGTLGSCALALMLAFENADQHRRLFETHSALLASNQALHHLSRHDALTGLPNRRYFDAHLEQQSGVMRRHKRCMAIVVFDVDHFKSFNDRFGHQAGDECLAHIAQALQSCCRRAGDLAARYGGEEFAFILPETDLSSAMRVAQRARETVERLQIPQGPESSWPFVTISGGVAVYDGRHGLTPDDVIAAADEALFQAKSRGRNKIISQSFERPSSAIHRLHAVN
jgi:diguanylate cyclase (GGDEF)-like protein